MIRFNDKNIKALALIATTFILLLAATTRIINIDGPALWTDEGFTYYTFKIDLFEALVGDRHPPFYFYTLHAWVEVAGESILAMRWWSFLPSMLTIAVAYQIGRELLHHLPHIPARVGAFSLPVLAALMMALTDGENYLAQELRMYTWHTLFAALSTLFYLKYIRKQSIRWAGWWVFSSTMLIYTHYFGIYVLIAQGLHVVLFLRGRVRIGAIAALMGVGVLFLPWFLGVTLEQFSQDAVCVNCPPPDNWRELQTFPERWLGQQWPLMLLIFGVGIVQSVFAGMCRSHTWSNRLSMNEKVPEGFRVRALSRLFLLSSLIMIPIVITYVLGHEEVIFFAHRLSQITVPIVMVLALGLASFQRPARMALVAALVLYGVTTVDWYRIKVPWHRVTELVAEYAEPDELVLGEVGPEESALLYYLDHMLPAGIQTYTFPMWTDYERFTYYEDTLPPLLDDQPRRQTGDVTTAWVVFFNSDRGLLSYLDGAGYDLTMTRPYEHVNDTRIDVFRYDLLPDTPLADFTSGMTLVAGEVQPDDLRVDLWWQLTDGMPLSRDFVVSAYLLDENGVLVAQLDSQPANNTRPTSTWIPGEVIYDPRVLALTGDAVALPPGTYTVAVQVYAFAPDGTLAQFPTTDGDPFITLGTTNR